MSIASDLDAIYDKIDGMMHAGKIKEIDQILAAVSMDSTSTDLLLGYLTITLPVKSSLPSRVAFYEATRAKLCREHEADVDRILQGLK